MNKSIDTLYKIASKPSRLIIGLMSGTSLDGLDIALCNITGSGPETQIELVAFETISYHHYFLEQVREVFSKKMVSLEKLTLLNPWVARQHAGMILAFLKDHDILPGNIDLIASHGQTIYHAPLSLHGQQEFGNATLQIGDGDHLAVLTGIITLSDFRQKNIAAGGEGAPLAIYADYLLGSNKEHDVAMLNIGGIANFSYLPAGASLNYSTCTDTGPGNTLMDMYVSENIPGKFYDDNAAVASKGNVNKTLLAACLAHPFFKEKLPRSTGPELFNKEFLMQAIDATGVAEISIENMLATLNELTAQSIVDALMMAENSRKLKEVYVSGGGSHNPLLMQNLQEKLPGVTCKSSAVIGLHPDAKEAILFALLANEAIAGNSLQGINEKFPTVSLGKISLPC